MAGDRLTVRAMTPADLARAIDWAAAEGWNPGRHDAAAFLPADPDGFLVGEWAGEAVGCISAVAYGRGFGFVGFYIVEPAWRGCGFGLQIWRAGMARLAGRNVGLDGVVAQQDNYRRSGFVYAYANQRFEGIGGGMAPRGAVALAAVSFAELIDYDAAVFAERREAFLKAWIALPRSRALAVVRGGRLAGYGVIRACRRGHKIGPLFADDPEAAETLFAGLAATGPGEPLFLDVPRPNGAALDLATRHAMTPVFETARMYTGGDPGVPIAKVFGVTTFELG